MTEEFWKKKYYEEKENKYGERQEAIRLGQAVNLAQNELLQHSDNPNDVRKNLIDVSLKYYEILETLHNMVIVSTKKSEVTEIIMPRI